MTPAQQAPPNLIQTYDYNTHRRTLLTDGVNCWDISLAIRFNSILNFMYDLAHREDTSEWPLTTEPWHNYHELLETGELTLIAELHNLGQDNVAFSIPAAARTNHTLKTFLVDPVPRNHRPWKHLLTWLDKLVQLRQTVQDPAQPLTEKAGNPTGTRTPFGKLLNSQPVGNGVWQVETEGNQKGLMFSPELLDFLPYEIQKLRAHRLFTTEDKELPIMSVILGIDDSCTFNTAVNITKRYYHYGPVLPYLMDTVPQVHYHVYNSGNRHRTERIATLKSNGHAWAFCKDNVKEYGYDMSYAQCSGETCDWLRQP